MKKENKYVGKLFHTNSCGDLIIIEYINYCDVKVKFLDTGYTTNTKMTHVKNGKVRDYLKPILFGVGILGLNFTKGESSTPMYDLWSGVMIRCYSPAWHKRKPSYVNCTSSDNFKYYPYFKEWCNKQIGFGNKGWQLDKDILVKGNKIYSEDTCCFVPLEINNLFIKGDAVRGKYPVGVNWSSNKNKFMSRVSINGKRNYLGEYDTPEEAFYAYKQAKETYIKELANKWKDQIDPRVYEALMNYQVEITD